MAVRMATGNISSGDIPSPAFLVVERLADGIAGSRKGLPCIFFTERIHVSLVSLDLLAKAFLLLLQAVTPVYEFF